MTGGEAALVISSIGTLVTSIGSVMVSLLNSKKLDAVHESTNGLSKRNEAIAKKLGIVEGMEKEKLRNTEEH